MPAETRLRRSTVILSIFILQALQEGARSFQSKADTSEYGVDFTYPIHHYLDEKGLKSRISYG